MVRATGWRAGLAAIALAVTAGCQPPEGQGTPLALEQTPPTVRAAFTQDYGGTEVRRITRHSRGGQDYYTVEYAAADGAEHSVEFNGAGNEIDKH